MEVPSDGDTDFEGEERRRADFADAYGHEVEDLVEEEQEHAAAWIDANFAAEKSGRDEADDAGSHSDPGDSSSDDDRSGGGTGDDYDDETSNGYDDDNVGSDSGGYSLGERMPESLGGYDSG